MEHVAVVEALKVLHEALGVAHRFHLVEDAPVEQVVQQPESD